MTPIDEVSTAMLPSLPFPKGVEVLGSYYGFHKDNEAVYSRDGSDKEPLSSL